LILVVLVLTCRSAWAEPRERDVWYAYVADSSQRYGSRHIQVTKLPDGNYRFVRLSRILVDVLGINKEVIEEHGEYVVTPTYRPVSIETNASRSAGKTRMSGRLRGDVFEVSTTRAGVERTRTLGAATGVLFEACLDDWLADRPPGFEAGEVALFDEASCEVRPARVERVAGKESGSSWSVDRGPIEGKQRVVLGADGLRRESNSDDIGTNLRVCSAQEAQDLTYRKLNGQDMLMFNIGKDVGPPERLSSLTVELRWKGIPFDRFRLTDERQHVVEQSEDGGGYRAVVRIEAPKSVDKAVSFPIERAELAPFLGASQFIEPRDPGIAKTAREVVSGKVDALEAVKALSDWVFKNMEAAMIAETLTGPEVLACRKGKCSEYAILFASLARSVGIPTRIVLGERMIGGQWGGHMWNEAYVGSWVTVDASYGEVGTSFALLKFVDHETVEGTQEVRRKLPASLNIKIADFQKQPSTLADKFRTGVAGRVYTNADFGCRMTAPGEEWSIEDKSQPGTALLRFKVPGREDAQLHFVAFSLPAGLEPKMLLTPRIAVYKARLKGFEVITDEEHDVKGSTGRRVRFKHTGGDGKVHQAIEVVWRTKAAGFLLTLDAVAVAFDELEKGYNVLLKSFEDLYKK